MINLPSDWKPARPKSCKMVFRHPTHEERKLIAASIKEFGCLEAQFKFNISNTMTYAIRKEFGIVPRKQGRQPQYTKQEAIKWAEHRANGETYAAIAMNFGVCETTVRRNVNALKLN